jgi:hypothetical protein
MFLNKPYEELRLSHPNIANEIYKGGANENRAIPIAKECGVILRKRYFGRPGKKAILIIDNQVGGLHAVYFDGIRAIDPSCSIYTTEGYLKNTLYYFT